MHVRRTRTVTTDQNVSRTVTCSPCVELVVRSIPHSLSLQGACGKLRQYQLAENYTTRSSGGHVSGKFLPVIPTSRGMCVDPESGVSDAREQISELLVPSNRELQQLVAQGTIVITVAYCASRKQAALDANVSSIKADDATVACTG